MVLSAKDREKSIDFIFPVAEVPRWSLWKIYKPMPWLNQRAAYAWDSWKWPGWQSSGPAVPDGLPSSFWGWESPLSMYSDWRFDQLFEISTITRFQSEKNLDHWPHFVDQKESPHISIGSFVSITLSHQVPAFANCAQNLSLSLFLTARLMSSHWHL